MKASVMVGLRAVAEFKKKKLEEAAAKGTFNSLFHAASSIRKKAASVIERGPDPSPAGFPPHTRRGMLKRAIRFAPTDDKKSFVIGPGFGVIAKVGAVQEFGGVYKGTEFEERPYMRPAFDEAVPRLAGFFRGSIG